MTLDEVKLEIEYIQSINPRSPGANFNHDPACFARYCKMQERRILESVTTQLGFFSEELERMMDDPGDLSAEVADWERTLLENGRGVKNDT
jgi:hypothetical protein